MSDLSQETGRTPGEGTAVDDAAVLLRLSVLPGKRYEDWALTDPAGQGPDAVRAIRDEIDRRVQQLLGEQLAEA